MPIDWVAKLRYFLQTMAFCLTISAIQFAFQPERAYAIPLVYSVAIGGISWALIDFGRHAFPSAGERGWPTGLAGVLLPAGGIVVGYTVGTLLGDAWLGLSSWGQASRARLPLSLLITVLAGVSASYYFYNLSKAHHLENSVSEARRQASEAQLKLLETQLEPHMLFNTLANLRVLIGSDPARAQAMLDHIIAYLRATLAASRSSSHTLQAEFDRLRDYLELMAIRMGPRLRFTLELPAALASTPVPTLLLQPLVENSIQHGLEPKLQGGSVAVAARQENGDLVLEVRDTGVGMAQTPASPGGGFGMAQVRERIATAYGDGASLAVNTFASGGTCATIRLPLPP